jgi:hypothetical protein
VRSRSPESGRDPLADPETLTMAIEPLSAHTDGSPPAGEPLLTASSYASAVAGVDAQALQILREAGMPAADVA